METIEEPNLPLCLYPTTRYQGSKRKLLPWINDCIKNIEYDSVVDLFGGTGSVSYLFKRLGKTVIYNDYLHFNFLIGSAVIENSIFKLTDSDVEFILKDLEVDYPKFVEETFKGMFFTEDENRWVDRRCSNIQLLSRLYQGDELRFKQALAFYALFQSCLVKRPFNLFHRKNLYLRLNNVKRTFGNAGTWSKPFDLLFRHFCSEANELIFENGRKNLAFNEDAFNFDYTDCDLVYMDPPAVFLRR